MRLILAIAFAISVFGHSTVMAQESKAYAYDALGRLKKIETSTGTNAGLKSEYTYDDAGNRTEVKVEGSPFASSVRVVVLPLLGFYVMPISN